MATFVDGTSITLSNNDFDVLYKAFQDKNFCTHFENFAKEISDPKNLDHYERELKKLEKERGIDVTLLRPSPGIALQAEFTDKDSIVFINITVSSKIEVPNFSCVSSRFKWSVPHAVLKPRLEFDLGTKFSEWPDTNKLLRPCKESLQIRATKEGVWIYEIIVNPTCIDLVKQNEVLKNHLNQIARENINKILNVNLKNETFLDFHISIGCPSVSQIKSIENSSLYEKSKETADSFMFENKNYNQSNTNSHSQAGFPIKSQTEKFGVKIPTFKLKHVNHVTLQDYSLLKKDYVESLRPQTLLLEVDLKGVKSASDIDVHTSGREFHLKTEKDVTYNLDVTLPYEVEEEPESAKFDISTSVLKIELKVIQKYLQSALIIPNDSGIECENDYRTNSDEDNSSASSYEESDIKVEENDQQNINNYTQKHMPNWKCSQTDHFLFMNIVNEKINIKSIKLIITSLNSFKFSYKTKNEEIGSVPSLYEGVVSVAPNSFKNKGVTYHILDTILTVQVEKSSPGVWTKIEARINENSYDNKKEIKKNTKDCIYSFDIEPVTLELKDKLKNNSESVSSSIDHLKFCGKDLKISNTSKQDIEAFFKKPLLPHCTFTQSYNFLIINIVCKNVNIKNVHIESLDQKIFRFQYKSFGNGFTPMFYGGWVNTSPYTFKGNEISHHLVDDVLLIQVKKKKPCVWRKVRVGLEQKKMKEVKVKSMKNAQDQKDCDEHNKEITDARENDDESEYCKTESGTDEDGQTGNEETFPVETNKEKKKSSEIDIPQTVRNTNDCFVTGSWPRGILKSRSRSLSDSQVDSHLDSPLDNLRFSLDCDDEALTEVTEDDVEMSDDAIGSSPKKSVRFNEFVCKQVFRINSSIAGQKAKNLKKAQQRKRSRERKLSEGSQSSETENVTEQSDLGTTTEDESNTDAESVGKESKKGKHSSNSTSNKGDKKKREKCNKKTKKNKRPVLSLSNEMVFQLDDD